MMKSRLPGRSQSLPGGGEPLYQYVSLDDLLQPCSTCKRQSFKCTCIDTSIENPPLKRSEQAAMCDPPGEALRAFYGRCIGELNQAFKRAGEKIAYLKAAAPAVYNEVLRRRFYGRWFGELNLVFQRAVQKIKPAVRVLIKRVST